MLVNPSIYNNLGRFTSNYDLLTLQKKSGTPASTSKLTGYPYKNSLVERINQRAFQNISDFDSNFSSGLKSIYNTTKLLSNGKSTVYDDRIAVETSKAFDVFANEGAGLGKQNLKVSQLAASQKNTSASRAQNSILAPNSGGILNIKQNGKTQSMSFTFKEGESVSDGYTRLAKTINQSKMGVTAEVKTDDMGYAKLSLTSNETGTNAAFEVSGTLADEISLNDSKEEASNLKYELNGKAGESQSNQLNLNEGKITVNVKATNTTAEDFDIKTSSKTLESTLKDFASAFNKFVDDNQDTTNPLTRSIVKQLSNTVKRSLDKLDIEGISTDSKGQITIDETQLSKGLEGKVEDVKEALTKFDSFASNLTRKTDQVLKMPLYDVSPDFTNHRIPINPFMFNYTAQSMLNNLNQLGTQGSILDIRI